MTRIAVEQLLYLIDEAFQGSDHEQDLLSNLRHVRQEDWLWVPPGGARSIATIVGHVGTCKYAYDNHMFGDATMTWDDPLVQPQDLPSRDIAGTIEWLRESHRRLRSHVAALDDGGLLERRRRPEGGKKETRWLMSVLIQHDMYHAGEINHIRALLQGNDAWAWEKAT
jgi:uncharacterized damage-inducible protein DinB